MLRHPFQENESQIISWAKIAIKGTERSSSFFYLLRLFCKTPPSKFFAKIYFDYFRKGNISI